MRETTSTSMAYRPDVDGLRAIAVLSVVTYHAGVPWVPGGFVGVDVFFVISGFLITGLLERELAAYGSISIRAFYARRIRRLLPALAVVIVASLLLGLAIYPRTGELGALAKSAVASVLIAANQYFLAKSDSYFDAGTQLRPLAHIWSLSVEEQFYLVWPVLLLAVARASAGDERVRWTRRVLVVLVVASFALSVALVRDHPDAAFFVSPSRAWELGIGALLALHPVSEERRAPAMGAAAAAVGLTLVLIACARLTHTTPFPGWAALLPVMGTALVILGNAHAPASAIARSLGARIPVAIGLCAYGWYLWHWPLLAFGRYMRLGEKSLWPDIGLVVAALGLAILSLRFVERPFYRRGLHSSTPPGRTIRVGLTVMATLVLFSLSAGEYGKWAPKTAAEQQAEAIRTDEHPQSDDCPEQGPEWVGLPRISHCTVGGRTRPPSLAIWGDSHANAWSPLLNAAMTDPRDAYLILTIPACPPTMGLTPRLRSGRVIPECAQFNVAAIAALRRAATKGLTGVVLAARWPTYGGAGDISVLDEGSEYADSSNTSPAAALRSLGAGLDSSLTLLQQSNLRVLVLLSPPEVRFPLPHCTLRRATTSCGIDRNTYLRHAAATWGVVRAAAARHENVRVIDPSDFFCDAAYCPPFVRGHPALRDDDHVAASTAAVFGATLRNDLLWLRGGAAAGHR